MTKSYKKNVFLLVIALFILNGGAIYGQAQTGCWSPFSIEADAPNICEGEDTELNLNNPDNIPIISIQWYKYTPSGETPCGQVCPDPSQDPANSSDWQSVQSGGTNFLTNQLFQSTCFAAVVDTECCKCRSFVKVCVCDPLDTAEINAAPAAGYPGLQEIPGYNGNRACGGWQGTLTLDYNFTLCPTTVTWTLAITDSSGLATIENIPSLTPNPTTINTGFLTVPGNMCRRKYCYTATISNACGTRNVSFCIYIDRQPTADDLTLLGAEWSSAWNPPSTPSPLEICKGQSAVLRASVPPPCVQNNGEGGIQIISWRRKSPGGSWETLTNAGQTWTLFTNNLETAGVWEYLAKFKNGACEAQSSKYKIQVKPELSVAIHTNTPVICPPQITQAVLTALYPSCPGLTFTWYHNGVQMNETGTQIIVSEPGYYYVKVYDPDCDVEAKAEPVKICGKPVVAIAGPCGICEGETIELQAIATAVPDGCADNCTFSWTGPSFTPTTPDGSSIQVTWPNTGTYTVTAECNSCFSEPASITVIQCQEVQPCDCGHWSDAPIQIAHNNTTFRVKCGEMVPDVPVNILIKVVNAYYNCQPDPDVCHAAYTWEIYGPSSLLQQGDSLPILFTPTETGFHKLIIYPKCGETNCPICTVPFKVIH